MAIFITHSTPPTLTSSDFRLINVGAKSSARLSLFDIKYPPPINTEPSEPIRNQ